MARVTRTKQETVATVTASNRKIHVVVSKEMTIEESRELRGLLKAEERKAESQSTPTWGSVGYIDTRLRYYNGFTTL